MMLLPVLLAAGLLIWLGTQTSIRVSTQLGQTVLREAVARVQTDLRTFLASAVRVSDQYTRRLLAEELPSDELSGAAWQRVLFDDLAVNPDVASISFGAADGDCVWLLRGRAGLERGLAESSNNQRAVDWPVDTRGQVGLSPLREYRYDPRQRPWYSVAQNAFKPGEGLWTPVYFWFDDYGPESIAGTGFVRTIRARANASNPAVKPGELLGVLVVDVTLRGLGEFLRSVPLAKSSTLFIVDDLGLLVASSQPNERGAVNSAKGERLTLAQSLDPAGGVIAATLERGGLAAAGTGTDWEGTLPATINGERTRIAVAPLRPYPGIDWRLIAAIPESAFLGDAQAARSRALWIGALCTLGALSLALALSRRISGPLLSLVQFVRRVGAGDFDARIELKAARELKELSGELNKMTGGLRHRMELEQSLAVAEQVQQSLLPQAPPQSPGLDIAGKSRYCDTTGGDYFDFLQILDLPAPVTGPATGPALAGQRTLVAVGDVMGHGIGSALLMASARAALRGHALDQPALGKLMTRVNQVLSRDARHGKFMTLLLLAIDPDDVDRDGHADPDAVRVTWASAGHDSPLVYLSGRDEFLEPEGADVPLVLEEDWAYEDYSLGRLAPGTIIVLGTDGIWEAANAQKELFSKDRLREIVRASSSRSAAEIVAAIESALDAFLAGLPAQDDITMIVVKIISRAGTPA
jgi:phosphoserine phosphatase RsbU/P